MTNEFKKQNKIFTEQQCYFLQNEMCINIQEFEKELHVNFKSDAQKFKEIINFLINYNDKIYFKSEQRNDILLQEEKFEKRFKTFIENNSLHLNIDTEDDRCHYYHDLANYFKSYWKGGIKELYIFREANYNGPRIYLNKKLATDEDLEELENEIIIYRGMSREEYNSNCFGMSWSLDFYIAKRFACDSSPDDTVVLKATVNKEKILLFYKGRGEKEVVVENGTITTGEIVWASQVATQ